MKRVITLDTLRRHGPERGLRIEVDADDYEGGVETVVGEYAGCGESAGLTSVIVETAPHVLVVLDGDGIFQIRVDDGRPE